MDLPQTDMNSLQTDMTHLRLNDQVDNTPVVQEPHGTDHRPAENLALTNVYNTIYIDPGSICITPKSSADPSKRKIQPKKAACLNLLQNRHRYPATCTSRVSGNQPQAEPTSLPGAPEITVEAASPCVISTPPPDPTNGGNFSAQPKSILRKKKKGTPSSQASSKEEEKKVVAAAIPFSFNTPNAPSDRGIPLRAHSTPIDGLVPVPATPRIGKVKFNASTNFDLLGEKRLKKIASVVRESVHVFHSCSERWRSLKSKGATELDAIVGYKMDAQGNIARTVSFVAVAHMVEMTSLLKEMDEMACCMRTAVLEVANVDLPEEEFQDVRPFKRLSLLKIMALMNYLAKSYRADYSYRNKVCTEVSRCCHYDAPTDRCVNVFSNIKSRWALEPMFDKNDAYLDNLVSEIGGLDAKDE